MADQKHDRPAGADAAEGVTAEQGSTIPAIARHTETPWGSGAHFINSVPVERYPTLDGTDCHSIAKTFGPNARANAEFIVRACNSHEELLAALKELRGAIVVGSTDDGKEELSRDVHFEVALKADAAIAKAEGR